MDALIELPGKELARPGAKSGGLALINETLTEFAETLQILDLCQQQMDWREMSFLAADTPLSHAKRVLSWFLRDYAKVCGAKRLLEEITGDGGRFPITKASASKMLSVLFGALAKKKADDSDENAATLMMVCIDMFDPTSESVGKASGFWQPVAKHPLVLALAIKRLLGMQKFMPSPSEVREAMTYITESLEKRMCFFIDRWLKEVECADQLAFEQDRAAWEAAYVRVDSWVPSAMLGHVELRGEGPSEDRDENGKPEYPPSPRWLALNAICEANIDAEEAAVQARLAGPPKRKRIAAAKKRSESKRSSRSDLTRRLEPGALIAPKAGGKRAPFASPLAPQIEEPDWKDCRKWQSRFGSRDRSKSGQVLQGEGGRRRPAARPRPSGRRRDRGPSIQGAG